MVVISSNCSAGSSFPDSSAEKNRLRSLASEMTAPADCAQETVCSVESTSGSVVSS